MSIKAKNISMYFDDAGKRLEIFSGLNFEADRNESIAIVGVSGVGKTTLLHILGGIEIPRSGDVELNGVSYRSLLGKRDELAVFRGKHIGFVFQFHYLLPEFDAVENVAMPLLIQGRNKSDAYERAKYLLDKMSLSHRLSHRPGMLSGGEQQRVAIARAFASSPEIILADEPTGNLDDETSNSIFSELKSLQKEEKTTLIFVTHSKELAGKMDKTFQLNKNGLSIF